MQSSIDTSLFSEVHNITGNTKIWYLIGKWVSINYVQACNKPLHYKIESV